MSTNKVKETKKNGNRTLTQYDAIAYIQGDENERDMQYDFAGVSTMPMAELIGVEAADALKAQFFNWLLIAPEKKRATVKGSSYAGFLRYLLDLAQRNTDSYLKANKIAAFGQYTLDHPMTPTERVEIARVFGCEAVVPTAELNPATMTVETK